MATSTYLSGGDIEAWRPDAVIPPPEQRNGVIKQRLIGNGLWRPQQTGASAGRSVAWRLRSRSVVTSIAACYLSEHSQAVHDLPLEELFRRIDLIFAHYGPRTDVQVTGGDPTLRQRDELVAIVRYITAKDMRASLFTNGILATRDLLRELGAAGLVDVAFHVDMTQGRKGYRSECELNAIRSEYIERARGLNLAVIFNTTLFSGNFHEVPELTRFFSAAADVVSFVSFQLQADTGRGVLRQRTDTINIDNTIARIEQGADTALSFDTLLGGHHHCNCYAFAFVVNGKLYDALSDPDFAVPFMIQTAHVAFDRRDRWKAVRAACAAVLKKPNLWFASLRWCARLAWRARKDLLKAKGKVHKLSFFVHNFMDACQLERDRAESCVFMTMTGDGPISMCVHNAKRDAFILKPLRLVRMGEALAWNPVSGNCAPSEPSIASRRI